MRRNAGSVFVTQVPNPKPPRKTAIPASRLLKRLKAPTAATETKKNSVRSTPRYVSGLFRLLYTLFRRRVVVLACIAILSGRLLVLLLLGKNKRAQMPQSHARTLVASTAMPVPAATPAR